MRGVDLNCDCGDGFGAYRIGDDAAMLDIVTRHHPGAEVPGGTVL